MSDEEWEFENERDANKFANYHQTMVGTEYELDGCTVTTFEVDGREHKILRKRYLEITGGKK